MEDVSSYAKVRGEAQKLYFGTRFVWSLALKENVYFTAEGFNHIIFKNPRNIREQSSQVLRFKLLPRAIGLIGMSATYQEYEETVKELVIRRRKKRIVVTKTVRYWGIIAIIKERKIKVILRKVGDGKLHFWSIMPSWVTSKRRDVKLFTTMKGDPEEN